MESSCYCPYVRAFQYLVLTRSEMQLATFQNRYRSLTNVMTYLLMYLLRKYYVRLKMTKPASPKNTKNIAPLTSPSSYPQGVKLNSILMYCSEVVILCRLCRYSSLEIEQRRFGILYLFPFMYLLSLFMTGEIEKP